MLIGALGIRNSVLITLLVTFGIPFLATLAVGTFEKFRQPLAQHEGQMKWRNVVTGAIAVASVTSLIASVVIFVWLKLK